MGDQTLTQNQLLARQWAIESVHKVAEQPKELDRSKETLHKDMLSYANVLGEASRRMELLGISSEDVQEANSTPEQIRRNYQGFMNRSARRLEKEESYNQKTSKQEEAAKQRGEYTNYPTGQKALAMDVQAAYIEYKKGNLHVEESQGNEFVLAPGEKAEDAKMRIVMVMADRDKIKKELATVTAKLKNAPKEYNFKIEFYKKYYDRLQQRLDATQDALDTWFTVNGTTETGEKVSARDMKKARQHLDLALEKYENTMAYFKANVGEDMVSLAKTQPYYYEKVEEIEESDYNIANERFQLDRGIGSTDVDDINKLQNEIIANHPTEYSANKEEVDKLVSDIIARARRRTSFATEAHATRQLFYDGAHHENEAERLVYESGFEGIWKSHDAESKLLAGQIKAGIAYVRFLLEGKDMGAVNATFVEKTWGIKSPMDRLVNKRIQKLQDYDKDENWLATEQQMERRNEMADKLMDAQTDYEKNVALELASDYNLAVLDLQDRLQYDEHGNERPGHLGETTGYRDLARAYSTFQGEVTMTPKQLDDIAETMFMLRQGQKRDPVTREKTPASDAEMAQGFRDLYAQLRVQSDSMRAYMASHKEMFQRRTIENIGSDYGSLTLFYMKMQSLRDSLRYMRSSSVMAYITQEERDDLAETSTFCRAATDMAKQLSQLIEHFGDKSPEELLIHPPTEEHFDQATLEAHYTEANRQVCIDEINKSVSKVTGA